MKRKVTAQDVRRISVELGYGSIEMTDQELQADIDDFFDEEAAREYEKKQPKECARVRSFFRITLLLIEIDSY